MEPNASALDSAWSAPPAGMKEIKAETLRKLAQSPTTPSDVLARTTLVAGLHDAEGYADVFDECLRTDQAWARILGAALFDMYVPEFDLFDPVRDAVFPLHRRGVGDLATPFTCDTLPSPEVAEPEVSYMLRKEAKKTYLVELLGEKNAALLDPSLAADGGDGNAGPAANPAGNGAIPLSANVSRMLGRRTTLCPTAGAARKKGVAGPIAHPVVRPARKPEDQSPVAASARFRALQASASRKKSRMLSDTHALPPPPDSLRARTLKLESEREKKATWERKRKAQRASQLKLQRERKRQRAARKQAVAKEHREEMARYRDEVVTDDESEASLELPAKEDEADEETDESEEEQVVKRKRTKQVPMKESEMRVPRLKGDPTKLARTGAEAHAARARIPPPAGGASPIAGVSTPARPAGSVIGPAALRAETARRRASTASAGARSGPTESAVYRKAVGDACRSLSPADRAQIIAFLDPATDHTRFFGPAERDRDFVLDEPEKDTLLLRIRPNGTWQRVRMVNAVAGTAVQAYGGCVGLC